MQTVDMTHLVKPPLEQHRIVADLPDEAPADGPAYGLFMVVSRFAFVADHVFTYLPCAPGRRELQDMIRTLDLGDDIVAIDLHERFDDAAAANARLDKLKSERLHFNVARIRV